MTDTEKLKIAINKATAIIFLNQQWLGHLREVIEDAGFLDDPTRDLLLHAKRENRQVFNEIKSLTDDAQHPAQSEE